MLTIITGKAYEGSLYEDRRMHFYTFGKEKIKCYPKLFKILKKFDNFDLNKYTSNSFLNLASRATSDVMHSHKPNILFSKQLEYYEKIIADLNLSRYPRNKKQEIITRMRSFDEEQSCSIIQELDFYFDLQSNTTVSNIFFNQLVDSTHDFRINVEEIEFRAYPIRLTSM